MADWSTELPGKAAEGNPGHPEDHNKIVDAIREVRSNVDEIELTPGPPGEDGTNGADGADGEEGPAGTDGADGADGFPSQEQWDALVARVEALEPGE